MAEPNDLRAEHRRLVDELRRRRIDLGMTQQQVADQIGVSRSQVANVETGTGNSLFSVETLIGYSMAVGSRLMLT